MIKVSVILSFPFGVQPSPIHNKSFPFSEYDFNLDLFNHLFLKYCNIRELDHNCLKTFYIFLYLDNNKVILESVSAPFCFFRYFYSWPYLFPNSFQDILVISYIYIWYSLNLDFTEFPFLQKPIFNFSCFSKGFPKSFFVF